MAVNVGNPEQLKADLGVTPCSFDDVEKDVIRVLAEVVFVAMLDRGDYKDENNDLDSHSRCKTVLLNRMESLGLGDEITPKAVAEVRKAAMKVVHTPFLIIGDAGVGKSQRIKGYTRKLRDTLYKYGFFDVLRTHTVNGKVIKESQRIDKDLIEDPRLTPEALEELKKESLAGYTHIEVAAKGTGEMDGVALASGQRLFPAEFPLYDKTLPYVKFDVSDSLIKDKGDADYAQMDRVKYVREGDNVVEKKVAIAKRRNDQPFGIFFLDELTNASMDQQTASYKLLDSDRGVNGYEIPEMWVVLAAGNGPEWDNWVTIPSPLLSRCNVYKLKTQLTDWLPWAEGAGRIDPHIISFLRIYPAYAVMKRSDILGSDSDTDKPIQCPNFRSWTLLSDDLRSASNSFTGIITGIFEDKVDLFSDLDKPLDPNDPDGKTKGDRLRALCVKNVGEIIGGYFYSYCAAIAKLGITPDDIINYKGNRSILAEHSNIKFNAGQLAYYITGCLTLLKNELRPIFDKEKNIVGGRGLQEYLAKDDFALRRKLNNYVIFLAGLYNDGSKMSKDIGDGVPDPAQSRAESGHTNEISIILAAFYGFMRGVTQTLWTKSEGKDTIEKWRALYQMPVGMAAVKAANEYRRLTDLKRQGISLSAKDETALKEAEDSFIGLGFTRENIGSVAELFALYTQLVSKDVTSGGVSKKGSEALAAMGSLVKSMSQYSNGFLDELCGR